MTYKYIGMTRRIATSSDPLSPYIELEKNEPYELTIYQTEISHHIGVDVYYGARFVGYLFYETAVHFFECWQLAYN